MVISGKHDSIRKRYGVSSSPQIFFLAPDGKKVGEGSRAADALIKQIDETAVKHGRAPKWAETEESAIAAAKEGQMPLVVVYRDDKPRSESALQEFGAQPLSELYDKFVWVQKTLNLKSDEAKALGITAVPALWIVDVRVDDPKTRVLKKAGLPKAGAAIKADLAAILKAWKKSEATKE